MNHGLTSTRAFNLAAGVPATSLMTPEPSMSTTGADHDAVLDS